MMEIPRPTQPDRTARVTATVVENITDSNRPAAVPTGVPSRVTAEVVEDASPVAAAVPQANQQTSPTAARVATASPTTPPSQRPNLPQAPPTAPTRIFDQTELLAAIAGPIERVPTTLSYRVAASVVAILMILLPLVYVAIIAAAIYGVYWYAIYGTAIFQANAGRSGRGGFILLLLYVGPLIVGVMTILFMIKPLFARPARSEGKRALERTREPKLFAFVDKLCESVHAPKPKRIDVDCDVNASASFRRGMLSMLLNGDLVLTIGMPLAAGLSARQLAGVLAHEFGHFSQGFGMRVSYIVRSVSHWFARVVYERDEWDDWLARTANSLDLRIGIVLHLARLLIWLTRRILWALMMVGHIFSCYLLRQMEFDADLHEIRFSGSDTFRTTSMQLRRLGVAYQQGMIDQQTFFMDGKLGDNLPKLTCINRDTQDDKLVKKIFSGVMEEKTEWLTTHPVDKDRVARAKQENEPGVFQLDAPASALFDHFDNTCEMVTQDMFKEIFDNEFKPNMLVPVEQLVSHKAAAKEANLAMRRLLGNYFRVPRQMAFAIPYDVPINTAKSTAALKTAQANDRLIARLHRIK
ncbi:MAG: M48 family metalloprotease [Pirellulaceae bacterium]